MMRCALCPRCWPSLSYQDLTCTHVHILRIHLTSIYLVYLVGMPPGRSRSIMTTKSVRASASESIVSAFCRPA